MAKLKDILTFLRERGWSEYRHGEAVTVSGAILTADKSRSPFIPKKKSTGLPWPRFSNKQALRFATSGIAEEGLQKTP
jgi:hypothetical protein